MAVVNRTHVERQALSQPRYNGTAPSSMRDHRPDGVTTYRVAAELYLFIGHSRSWLEDSKTSFDFHAQHG